MKTTRILAQVLGLGLLVGLTVIGCEPAKSSGIVVGKVDTATLLQDDPDYQSLSIEYMRENTDMRKKYVDKIKAVSDEQSKAKVQKEYEDMQRKLDGKWMERTQGYLQSRHSHIRDVAEKISKQKNIDIVIIDSRVYATVEYGGVDITKDMQLALSQEGGLKATPTPAKQEG